MLLLNSFSLNMLSAFPAQPLFEEISLDEARTMLSTDIVSAVGHASTAAVFQDVLGLPVPTERSTVLLDKGTVVVVGQYRGPRLPEGAMHLPDGATIQWLRVTV